MKLVHIDLKGAPPKPRQPFWQSFCATLCQWGVHGLLVEWEDAAPLPLLDGSRRDFAYSRQEVDCFLAAAFGNGLHVVPLVQTFGHLEYMLKDNKRKHLREMPDYSDSLCPIDCSQAEDESFRLVSALIDQVVALTPQCSAIHLGGDEVWHLGKGAKSRAMLNAEPGLNRETLYLRHMTKLVGYVKHKYPDKRILMWDDMLRSIPKEQLRMPEYFTMTSNIEPVIWCYSPQPDVVLPDDLWPKYQSVFPSVWVGTAFKGASSSCAQLPPLLHHVTNHLNWLHLINRKTVEGVVPYVNGYILTGWQRFDHFAALCELLPVSIPSLRCCLLALGRGQFGCQELIDVSLELGVDLRPDFSNGLPALASAAGSSTPVAPLNVLLPSFPGSALFVLMRSFESSNASYHDLMKHDIITTWFSDYHLQRGRISVLQIQILETNLIRLLCEFRSLRDKLKPELDSIYPEPVVQEWLATYIDPAVDNLSHITDKASKALKQ